LEWQKIDFSKIIAAGVSLEHLFGI
jgi:hypothetical protein